MTRLFASGPGPRGRSRSFPGEPLASADVPEPAIVVRGLRKSYGGAVAVAGIDLTVETGEVFAFLGPNGAGKTSTVEILEGYRSRDAGDVSVLGVDPAHPDRAWRARVGVVLQSGDIQRELTARELVELFAGYYERPLGVDHVLGVVGLTEHAAKRARRLSGGQRRRLDVALALIGDPELLFLDEPTTGFDPAARRDAWTMIEGLRDLGKTVFLTTHYLDEAEALADRVAIIKAGRIVAEGRPADIGGAALQVTAITFRLPADPTPPLPHGLAGAVRVDADGQTLIETRSPVADLALLCTWAEASGVALEGLEARRPSLEDVYLQLTDEAPLT